MLLEDYFQIHLKFTWIFAAEVNYENCSLILIKRDANTNLKSWRNIVNFNCGVYIEDSITNIQAISLVKNWR